MFRLWKKNRQFNIYNEINTELSVHEYDEYLTDIILLRYKIKIVSVQEYFYKSNFEYNNIYLLKIFWIKKMPFASFKQQATFLLAFKQHIYIECHS